jgi:hypothetical protein
MKATSTIWKTVVFAGAMLGTPACSKKQAPTTPTTPTNTAKPADTSTTTEPGMDPTNDDQNGDPSTDPCAGMDRPRGTDDDGGGGMGRGFVLS